MYLRCEAPPAGRHNVSTMGWAVDLISLLFLPHTCPALEQLFFPSTDFSLGWCARPPTTDAALNRRVGIVLTVSSVTLTPLGRRASCLSAQLTREREEIRETLVEALERERQRGRKTKVPAPRSGVQENSL